MCNFSRRCSITKFKDNELHAPDLRLVREKDVELNVDVQISKKVETLKKSEKWGSI